MANQNISTKEHTAILAAVRSGRQTIGEIAAAAHISPKRAGATLRYWAGLGKVIKLETGRFTAPPEPALPDGVWRVLFGGIPAVEKEPDFLNQARENRGQSKRRAKSTRR